jgi:hypothetical protein
MNIIKRVSLRVKSLLSDNYVTYKNGDISHGGVVENILDSRARMTNPNNAYLLVLNSESEIKIYNTDNKDDFLLIRISNGQIRSTYNLSDDFFNLEINGDKDLPIQLEILNSSNEVIRSITAINDKKGFMSITLEIGSELDTVAFSNIFFD